MANLKPTVDDFTSQDETIVYVDPNQRPDSLGRIQFTAHWITDQPWVPGGVRGQVFHTNLAEFINRTSGSVRVIES